MGEFFHSFVPGQTGWLFMWAILILFVISVAIIIERMYYISVRSNVNAPKFMLEIRKLVLNGDYTRAIALCKSASHRALPEVVRKALEEAEKMEFIDFRTIQNTVDEAALEIIPRLSARTGYLAMIANVSTLIGLLGTIFGLIVSFASFSAAGGGSVAGDLARGISIAMYTTFAGLSVAIPSFIFHHIITSATTAIIDDIDEHSVKLIHLLTGSAASGN
jgi:biopolymer transport protein ExbB/TolQ